ncbi:MAG: sigma-70 family RNA polymerase sigma factor [Opitutaceae bacterium]|nr:sigma-70 family RNA polymerase sigma factor [Opitutaceae bacterium]
MTLPSPLCADVTLQASAADDPAEGALVRAAVAGEGKAFEALIQLHGNRVFNYIYQMTRQAQDAEDLTQQTFIKAFANLHRVDTTRPLIGWLLTIARRTALNHFRSVRHSEPVADELPSQELSPAQQAERRDRINDLWAHARRVLAPRDFEILWLRFAEDLSVAETARVVGLTQTHVKILVFRSRRTLIKTPFTP